MKLHLIPTVGSKPDARGRGAVPLKPRSSYPTLAITPLHRSPLRKLAWIFGFGR
jgi:hypothetical protein